MSDDGFDLLAGNARHLTPLQWTALRKCIVRRAHEERNRAIRQMLVGAFAAIRSAWRRVRCRQEARAELCSMTDRELRDIGLSRSGIEAAIRRNENFEPRCTTGPLKLNVFEDQSEGEDMSKAYWIVRVSVRDHGRYPDYLAAARPAFEKFGARFVVRGGAFETMEGSARDRNVVVEFADRDTAMACYRSSEYQVAKAVRQKYADADFIIIDGAT
jgi:uncharacterized protein (DUF1330 family)/uncharacterized protein YjiS (DUF1127 family)